MAGDSAIFFLFRNSLLVSEFKTRTNRFNNQRTKKIQNTFVMTDVIF